MSGTVRRLRGHVARVRARISERAVYAVLTALLVSLAGFLFVVDERRSAREAAQSSYGASLATRLEPLATRSLPKGKLPRGSARALTRSLGELASSRDSAVRLWSRNGKVVFAAGRRLGRSETAIDGALQAALAGKVSSVTLDGRRPSGGGAELATFVPYRTSPEARPAGAFEVRSPYGRVIPGPSVAAFLPLIGGLALLWVALLAVGSHVRHEARRAPDLLAESHRDPLTDLPNRATFRQLLERELIAAKRKGGIVGVLMMDLDRFKEINDTLGHYNGDVLLKRIGPRLRSVLRDSDVLARLGGDEFTILLPDLPNEDAVAAAAKRLIGVLEEPFVLGGLALEIEASVGIALYPEHGNRVDVLLNRADTAMYAAKRNRTRYALYADEQERGSRRRLALSSELRRAIAGDEIVVHYQPKVRLATGQVVGVEALARWRHPTKGVIAPDEFIPIAEQTNQLTPLTECVLDQALGQAREWQARGIELTVSVNLSVRNLLDSGLARQVEDLLHRWAVDPAVLELEITESMLMSDRVRAKDVLCRLKEVGVRLSVDDFGTGYSSLGYLKDLPVDAVKMDKSFVLAMGSDERSAAIVRSIVGLGRHLGLEVVAEGVETQSSYDELARLGCDYAQGYLLARPLPSSELVGRLQELERDLRVGQDLSADGPRLRAVPTSGGGA